jgi:hypothetical protein
MVRAGRLQNQACHTTEYSVLHGRQDEQRYLESKSCVSSTCHTPVSRYNIESLEITTARDLERVE